MIKICRRGISNKQINRKKKRERDKKKENKKAGYIVPNMNRNPRNG